MLEVFDCSRDFLARASRSASSGEERIQSRTIVSSATLPNVVIQRRKPLILVVDLVVHIEIHLHE